MIIVKLEDKWIKLFQTLIPHAFSIKKHLVNTILKYYGKISVAKQTLTKMDVKVRELTKTETSKKYHQRVDHTATCPS